MKMMMNCFCGMVNRLKAFSLISSWDHFQRSSPSQISDTPRAEFEPVQNLTPGFVERSCAEVIAITPRRHSPYFSPSFKLPPFFFKYCSLCDSNGIRTHNHLVRRQVRTPQVATLKNCINNCCVGEIHTSCLKYGQSLETARISFS